MSRLVLVGEAPGGRGEELRPALEGLVGKRLAQMMGLEYPDYLRSVTRRNIYERPDDGRRWKAPEAKRRAANLMMHFEHGDRVVLLGNRVSEAFGVSAWPLFSWRSFQRVMTGETYHVARVPHPSGRNRALNDETTRRQMARFLRAAYADRR